MLDGGEAACWGENANGELADLSDDWRRTPITVPQLGSVGRVAVGDDHSCAISAGRVFCWGSNDEGQLGAGIENAGATPVPQEVTGIGSAIGLVAGAFHTCALNQDGFVFCWGSGRVGQIGEASESSNLPVDVSIIDVVELAAGYDHNCARTRTGGLWCWGQASSGQLGPGRTEHTHDAIEVLLPGPVDHVVAGEAHTCAVSGGDVYCWGENDAGQLGDGSLFSRAEPAPVNF